MQRRANIITAIFPVCHAATASLCVLWWLECEDTNLAIAAVGFAVSLMSLAAFDRLLALWVHLSIAAHLIVGIRFGWYETSAVYDEFVHALAMASLVYWCVVRLSASPELQVVLNNRRSLLFIASGLGLAFGAAWELFEFAIDSAFHLGAQQSLRDTNLDLVADLLGGGGAYLIMRHSVRPHVAQSKSEIFNLPRRILK